MLYSFSYEIVGITGPGGAVDTSKGKLVEFSKGMAEIALDHLGDSVSFVDWFDSDGELMNRTNLLLSDDTDELVHQITQISDELKSQGEGYLDFCEYSDLFTLLREQNVKAWCSESIRQRILTLQDEYYSLIVDLSDEWTAG